MTTKSSGWLHTYLETILGGAGIFAVFFSQVYVCMSWLMSDRWRCTCSWLDACPANGLKNVESWISALIMLVMSPNMSPNRVWNASRHFLSNNEFNWEETSVLEQRSYETRFLVVGFLLSVRANRGGETCKAIYTMPAWSAIRFEWSRRRQANEGWPEPVIARDRGRRPFVTQGMTIQQATRFYL